jgi:ABC-2 type transport system permease protein
MTTTTSTSAPAGIGRVPLALAGRSLIRIYRVPATFIPSIVMPIFLVTTFSGLFGALTRLPGFPVDDMIDWMLPMAIVQGSAFAGTTSALGIAFDIENGFFDRLLLSPAPRRALLAGPILAGALRSLVPFLLVLPAGVVVGGARLHDPFWGVLSLLAAAVGTSLLGAAWGLGVALRFPRGAAAPVMQLGIFAAVFLSTAQVPLAVMSGWLRAVARVNPMTQVFALARQGFVGDVTWHGTWRPLLALAGFFAFLLLFAARGLRRFRG